MSTQYSNTLTVQNHWNSPLLGVWIKYSNDSTGSRYFDNTIPAGTSLSIGGDLALSPPDAAIISETGESDHWTISFADSSNRLWGTAQDTTVNIPHNNGMIEISFLINKDTEEFFAVFNWPNGKSSNVPLIRI